jgi:predicted nucleic acid-binding protein
MEVTTIFQFLFWVLLGLWYLGVRFTYIDFVIGAIALVNGLLIVI